LKIYGVATGAKINIQKWKALALGSRNISVQIMDMPYSEEMKVLSLHIKNTIHASVKKSWNVLISRIRAQVLDPYQRALDLDQGIRYIHEYPMARAWYLAQIFPTPDDNLRQINVTITWFLWKRETFRVPISTLQRTKQEGGGGMIQSTAKCMALLYHRMREQGNKNETVTAVWMTVWGLQEQTKNPPNAWRTLTTLEYLHRYDMDSAYLAPGGQDETTQGYKKVSTLFTPA
jgi:nitrate reductase beta subunit